MKHKVTWFVLADGARARVLKRSEESSGLDVIAEYEAQSAHLDRQPGGGHAERIHEEATGRHATNAHADGARIDKAAFARKVAAHLNAAGDAGRFDALVLFAAPRSLPDYRAALDAATRAKLAAEVPKDLTKLPLADLPRHFASYH